MFGLAVTFLVIGTFAAPLAFDGTGGPVTRAFLVVTVVSLGLGAGAAAMARSSEARSTGVRREGARPGEQQPRSHA